MSPFLGRRSSSKCRNDINEIVAYLKAFEIDTDKVELRRSTLGGFHVTFNFNEDETETEVTTDSSTAEAEASESSEEEDAPLLRRRHRRTTTYRDDNKSQAVIAIETQHRLLREWNR